VIYLVATYDDEERILLFSPAQIYFGSGAKQDLVIKGALERHAVLIKKDTTHTLKRQHDDALITLNGHEISNEETTLKHNDVFAIAGQSFRAIQKEDYAGHLEKTRFEKARKEIEDATHAAGLRCERIGEHLEARGTRRGLKVLIVSRPDESLTLEGELTKSELQLRMRPFSPGVEGMLERWRSRKVRPDTVASSLYVEGNDEGLAFLRALSSMRVFRGVLELKIDDQGLSAKWKLRRYRNPAEGSECMLDCWLQAIELDFTA